MNTPAPAIRAAIVGFGWWGKILAGYLGNSELMRPVLVVEPEAAGRASAASMGLATCVTFEEAISRDDVDAVILCSPHRFHSEQIIAAAKAGKHVFCEKPLCTTAAEADAAISAVIAAGVQLGIGHERRFEPAIIELRRRFACGEFGTLLSMEGNFSQDKFLDLPPDNWRLSPVLAPVGPLSATGIHLVDLAIAVFGKPSEVWARLATRGTNFANGDTLTITLAFENGTTALLTAILATPFMGRVCVFGSKGWFDIRDRTHPEHPTGWDVTTTLRDGGGETRFFAPHPAVRDNLEAFARAAQGGAPYPVSHDEMSANVRTFEAIIRSVGRGGIERI
ncbi:MAG: oxidoreductase [Hyphomicrobiales bacterium]|nr:oxidoreductase [Hyphomicrobiales bacterium]